eukprot:2156383-Pyramimonas_sp.AAC.1
MNYFFRHSSSKESPKERHVQEASTPDFAPTTQQSVRDTTQRVKSLRSEAIPPSWMLSRDCCEYMWREIRTANSKL